MLLLQSSLTLGYLAYIGGAEGQSFVTFLYST